MQSLRVLSTRMRPLDLWSRYMFARRAMGLVAVPKLRPHFDAGLAVVDNEPSAQWSQYHKLLDRLLTINMDRQVKLGLDSIRQLENSLGPLYSDQSYHTIHVAGTNGKGSVATKLARVLELHGFRVGLFTSPHLYSYRERFQVNGECISEEHILDLLPPIFDAAEKENIPASFFELTTLLGLAYFSRMKVDFAVVEVGLGGRLDATNIINPLLALITSIGLDHMNVLGDTIEQIAAEKAGIIKPSVGTVVVGPNVPLDITRARAAAVDVPHALACDALREWSRTVPHSPLACLLEWKDPTFDVQNQITAAGAAVELFHLLQQRGCECELEPSQLEEGLLVRPPCRFEEQTVEVVRSGSSLSTRVNVVVDVAHNVAGMRLLLKSLALRFPDRPVRTVLGMARKKAKDEMVQLILANSSALHLVAANHYRAASLEELKAAANGGWKSDLAVSGSVDDTVTKAVETAACGVCCPNTGEAAEVVLICGSFFIMAEAQQTLRKLGAQQQQPLARRHGF